MFITLDDVQDSEGIQSVAGMAEWLDDSTFVQRVSGLKPPSDLSQRVRRELDYSL